MTMLTSNTPAFIHKEQYGKKKKGISMAIKEYGGKEVYKSKAAMKKHEKKEGKKVEKKEKKMFGKKK